jgi:hypothetical protein
MPQVLTSEIIEAADLRHNLLNAKWFTTTATITQTGTVFYCDATSAAFTVTLPDAITYKFRMLILKKTDGTANAVTLDGEGSQTIDGGLTLVLANQNDAVALVSDGVNWSII